MYSTTLILYFHLALQAVIASSSSSIKAEVLVYGTPAEEGGGGKCKMIDAKVFDELDLCMMVHPSPYEVPDAIILARTTMRIVYTGESGQRIIYRYSS